MSYVGAPQPSQMQRRPAPTTTDLDNKLTNIWALAWETVSLVVITLMVVLYWSYKILKVANEIHNAFGN